MRCIQIAQNGSKIFLPERMGLIGMFVSGCWWADHRHTFLNVSVENEEMDQS